MAVSWDSWRVRDGGHHVARFCQRDRFAFLVGPRRGRVAFPFFLDAELAQDVVEAVVLLQDHDDVFDRRGEGAAHERAPQRPAVRLTGGAQAGNDRDSKARDDVTSATGGVPPHPRCDVPRSPPSHRRPSLHARGLPACTYLNALRRRRLDVVRRSTSRQATTRRQESRGFARTRPTMGTTEVQRTLVKSPPELWAELSDQDALARHLSDFGEIRITSTVAENAVHWESDAATGSALIRQAGWGTKVTLRATVTAAEPEPEREPAPLLATAAPIADRRRPPPASAPHRGICAEPRPPRPRADICARRGTRTFLAAGGPRPSHRSRPARLRRAAADAAQPRPTDAAAGTPDDDPPRRRAPGDASLRSRPGAGSSRDCSDAGHAGRTSASRCRAEREPTAAADGPGSDADERPAQADRPRAAEGTSSEPIQPTALEALQARFAVRPPPPEPPPLPDEPAAAMPRDAGGHRAGGARATGVADPAPEQRHRSTRSRSNPPPSTPRPSRPPAVDSQPTEAAGDTLSSELRRAEEIAAEDVRADPHRGSGQGDPDRRSGPPRGGPPQALLTGVTTALPRGVPSGS